jgi:hypothetical protein
MDRGQILVLLDSVARGFPIGSVLLWQSTQELRSENRIADLDNNLPRHGYPVNYLLDGQQRLSAMCGAIYWQGTTNPASRWNIAYDLRSQEFMHLETLDEPPLHQIRVNKLADPAIFFKHVALLDNSSLPDKTLLKQRADGFFNRFKDYKIATVTLGDMSIQDVAPIFERINSTGTPLTIVDLMRAATWSPEFDLIDSIQGILDNLAEKGYGTIDKKVLLRNISAAAGGGFSTDSIDALRKHDATKLKQAVQDTHEAFKRTVDFLTMQINIPTSDIVPYSNQLTILAEIFRRIPAPNANQYRSISQWFWKTALSGYFSGWNTGMMAVDLEAVRAFASGAQSIPLNAPKPNADIWTIRTFRTNNAHAKLLAIVLAHHAPVDLLTGQRVDCSKALAWTNVKEFHHFFPQQFLSSQGVTGTRINSLANIVMLSSASNKTISDKAPSIYLKDVVTAAGQNLDNWLACNLISKEAFEAALKDDYDTFLNLRAATIHEAVLAKTDWR